MTLELVKFALVGLTNTLIGFTAIAVLSQAVGLSAVAANAGGFGVGAVCSYLLNRFFTFGSTKPHRRALPQFLLLVGLCFGLNLLVLLLTLDAFQLHPLEAQAAAVLVYNVAFFLGSKFVVFRG
jgi:putative flippase GtrA